MASPIVECVPNFSEGRDTRTIDAIAQAISSVSGAFLLDIAPGADTNRTVYTFVGSPEAAVEAAIASARAAYGLIDMARHSGVHPRMGALDVCPFVPISGIGLAACAELSKRAAERIAIELDVPIYLYEAAASRPERRSLAFLRRGGYEALPAKLASSDWLPDFGPASFVPRWGASVIGARELLIAFNVSLNTAEKRLAEEVARRIRESGWPLADETGAPLLDEEGRAIRHPGRLRSVRAIGWYIDSYRCAQVSVNLLDYRSTPLHAVYEAIREEAKSLGLSVTGSEVIGLLPKECLVEAGRYFCRGEGAVEEASESELIDSAVLSLGLNSVTTFYPEKKILEFAYAKKMSLG